MVHEASSWAAEKQMEGANDYCVCITRYLCYTSATGFHLTFWSKKRSYDHCFFSLDMQVKLTTGFTVKWMRKVHTILYTIWPAWAVDSSTLAPTVSWPKLPSLSVPEEDISLPPTLSFSFICSVDPPSWETVRKLAQKSNSYLQGVRQHNLRPLLDR